MLAGTGLRAEFSRPDEAIIVAQPAAEQAPATADTPADAALPIDGIGDSGDRRAFAGLLQAHLIDALCAQPGRAGQLSTRRAGAHRQQGRWWRSTWWHRAVRPPATRR